MNTTKKAFLSFLTKSIALGIIVIFITLPIAAQELSRKIVIQENDKYLNFPIQGWSQDMEEDQKMMRIIHEGQVVDEFSINLANNDPDWWGFFSLEGYQEENITIELDDSSAKKGLDMVYSSPKLAESQNLYQERYRQQVHFSNKRGWNNDPNGMIYHEGKWHLYFQYNPYGWNWGNMHWGHAVSTDLIHWEELPAALYSPDHGHMAFSGGATIDPNNTTGFRRNGVNPLIATYTRTGSGEHLALSYDNGRTFEEYEGNPVVEHNGRDPKVIWYEPEEHWVMIVWSQDSSHARKMGMDNGAREYQHSIYTSDNMKDWEYQSGITSMFECPELFELPVEGEKGVSKWVVYDADGKYYIGDFDGKEFTIEQGLREFDHGGDFYASQTFSNVPEEDGRRIQIGWFQVATPFMPFNQSMTFPTELKLIKSDNEYILAPTPLKEIQKLHAESYKVKNIALDDSTFASPIHGDQLHIIAEVDRGDAIRFGLNINGFDFIYNDFRSTLNDTFYPTKGKNMKFEVIVDKMGMEVFIDDGKLYYAFEHNSVDNEQEFKIFADRIIMIENLEVYKLNSIWNEGLNEFKEESDYSR